MLKRFFTTLALIVVFISAKANNLGKGKYHYDSNPVISGVAAPSSTTLNIDAINGFNQRSVKSGTLLVSVNMGSDYIIGDNAFNFTCSLNVTLYSGAASIATIPFSISLSNDTPEAVYRIDLAQYTGTLATGLTFDNAVTNFISVTSGNAATYGSAVRIQTTADIEYGLDVQGLSVITPSVSPGPFARVKKFEWNTTNSSVEYPDYEIQILRLFNQDPSVTNVSGNDDQTINNVTYDWSKALSFETESANKIVYLSIGEGQGYYIWRIRPIGTFFEGGYANNLNYGNWSVYTEEVSINPQNIGGFSPYIFFYTDPDKDQNYIYSRTFTEGTGNQSEQVSYANHLQQIRQTQIYIPSGDPSVAGKTLVSQTLQDNVGRNALISLPVPVDGGLDGYKSTFLNKTGGIPYTTADFDNAAVLRTPAQVDQSLNTPYSYYSDNNTNNVQIPDAQGYPYTRTFFENEPGGAVKETTSPGLVHSVGTGPTQNHTVRTYYGTASETELKKLFWDESPKPENVFKTIQVDQNNTATVSYKNKEGQLIATALTFADAPENLQPVSGSTTLDQNVTDEITTNIKTENGFVSSKRITLLPTTVGGTAQLSINYNVSPATLAGMCGEENTIECNYKVTIKVINADDLSQVQSSTQSLINNQTFSTWNLTLAPGSYIIEKTLSKAGVSPTVSTNTEDAAVQLTAISDWIENSLKNVACETELMFFYNKLYSFIHQFNQMGNSITTSTPIHLNCTECYCSGCSVPADFTFPQKFVDFYNEYNLHNPNGWSMTYELQGGGPINSGSDKAPDKLPRSVSITTPCCGTTRVAVNYKPAFKCPTAADLVAYKSTLNDLSAFRTVNENLLDESHTVINPALPDFEGYAVSMMANCMDPADPANGATLEVAKQKVYKYMTGWNYQGMFNQMVFHMLTDVYSTNGLGQGDCVACQCTCGTAPTNVSNSDPCAPGSSDKINCAAYTCSDLAKCWTSLVQMVVDRECAHSYDGVNMGDGGKISDRFDQQQKGNKSVHDDNFDDNFDLDIPWPFGWFMEMLVSSRMRKKQDVQGGGASEFEPPAPTLELNIVERFLECTGYKFADIINHNEDCTTPTPYSNSPEYTTIPSTITSNTGCWQSLATDFDNVASNGEYDPTFVQDQINLPVQPVTGTPAFTLGINSNWKDLSSYSGGTAGPKLEKEFGTIRNPIYAFKYFEYAYGSKTDLELSTCFRDPNKCYDPVTNAEVLCCTDENGNGIPCNFCGIGYITCPTTKVTWNSGQRSTFFNLLKSSSPATVLDDPNPLPTNVLHLSCSAYYTQDYWVPNVVPSGSSWTPSPSSGPRAYLGEEFLPESLFTVVYGISPQASDRKWFRNVDGTNVQLISKGEIEMVKRNDVCKSGCAERKDEIKTKIINMLMERCYVIGGCKADANDNVIPPEDIDKMVDVVVAQCSSQCNLRSIDCRDEFCRDIRTEPHQFTLGSLPQQPACGTLDPVIANIEIIPGKNNDPDINGYTNQQNTVTYGVGGCLNGDPLCPYPTPSTGLTITTPPAANLSDYPYGEYTQYKQARDWDFDISLPSQCNDQGVYAGIGQGGFIKDSQGQWVSESWCNGNVTGIPAQEPNTTAMQKSLYESNANTAVDPNNPAINTPATSPKIKLGVHVTH